jgi:hypothetical protein
VDESIRKALPSQPVVVTAFKDGLLMLAGLIVVSRRINQLWGSLLLFAPWCLLTLLSSFYVAMDLGATLAPLAVARTYGAVPLLLACGYYLGEQPAALRRVAAVFAVGATAAVLVSILQEHARASLPSFLTVRIYKEGHSLAGGLYNESIFAAPQTLAVVLLVFMTFLAAGLIFAQGTGMRWAVRVTAQAGLLCLAAYALYLSRIRVAVPLAAFTLALVVVLSPRGGAAPGKVLLRVASGVIALSAVAVVFVAISPPHAVGTRAAERDAAFYMRLLDPTEWAHRLTLVFREIQDLPGHNMLFGYGAGTGGSIRPVIFTPKIGVIPPVLDTGGMLIYHELGLLGVAAFAMSYVWLLVRRTWQALALPSVPPGMVPALSIALALLIWFVLKSHTIVGNGLSHALWLGTAGMCGGMVRLAVAQRQAQAASRPEPAPPDEHLAPPSANAAPAAWL